MISTFSDNTETQRFALGIPIRNCQIFAAVLHDVLSAINQLMCILFCQKCLDLAIKTLSSQLLKPSSNLICL